MQPIDPRQPNTDSQYITVLQMCNFVAEPTACADMILVPHAVSAAVTAAIMRQDISWFDTQTSTGGLLQGLNEDSLNVQQALSDKVSGPCQNNSICQITRGSRQCDLGCLLTAK